MINSCFNFALRTCLGECSKQFLFIVESCSSRPPFFCGNFKKRFSGTDSSGSKQWYSRDKIVAPVHYTYGLFFYLFSFIFSFTSRSFMEDQKVVARIRWESFKNILNYIWKVTWKRQSFYALESASWWNYFLISANLKLNCTLTWKNFRTLWIAIVDFFRVYFKSISQWRWWLFGLELKIWKRSFQVIF